MSRFSEDTGVEVEAALRCIATEENLHNCDVVKVSGSVKGDGYLGVITRVRIDGEDESGNKKHLHVIVKCAPKSQVLRASLPLDVIYDREIHMYTTVLPTLINFQKEKCLVESFTSIAKCYKTLSTECSEAIILENLKENGFDTWDRQFRMDGAHVEMILREYGKFHALSFALRDQRPKQFEKLGSSLGDVFLAVMKQAGLDVNGKRCCLQALDALDPIADKEAYQVYEKFANHVQNDIFGVLGTTDECSVVTHGDCWSGNFMFQYNNADHPKKPSDVCFLDWQISTLGPPVLDVSYFFYATSSEEVIDNYKHYLRLYYDSLASHLKALGSDPEKLYPFAKFEEQWRNHSKYGLLLSSTVAYMLNVDEDKALDPTAIVESGDTLAEGLTVDRVDIAKANRGMRHVIKHFVENKFI